MKNESICFKSEQGRNKKVWCVVKIHEHANIIQPSYVKFPLFYLFIFWRLHSCMICMEQLLGGYNQKCSTKICLPVTSHGLLLRRISNYIFGFDLPNYLESYSSRLHMVGKSRVQICHERFLYILLTPLCLGEPLGFNAWKHTSYISELKSSWKRRPHCILEKNMLYRYSENHKD